MKKAKPAIALIAAMLALTACGNHGTNDYDDEETYSSPSRSSSSKKISSSSNSDIAQSNTSSGGEHSSSSIAVASSSSARSSSSKSDPVQGDKCGNSSINYEKQFCWNDKVYSLCNGSEYDPDTERCQSGAIQYKCGTSWYSPEKQFCWNDKVYTLCGGSSYDPANEKCQNNSVVALNPTPTPSSSSSATTAVIPSSSSSDPKCGGEKYDISTHYCSNNVLKTYTGTFTDSRDGKTYKYAKIGTQTWMAENLNYNAEDSKCYSNSVANCSKYGRLYTWHTAMDVPSNYRGASSNANPSGVQGVCPDGWHLPSDAEWAVLINFAGENAGTKLRSSIWNGADSYGFSALPSGNGFAEGHSTDVDMAGDEKGGVSIGGYSGIGTASYWWTSYDSGYYPAYYRCIGCYDLSESEVNRYYNQKTDLMAVRCVLTD